MVTEKRRYARTPIHVTVSFGLKTDTGRHTGVGRDISLGGMFVETDTPASFGADVTIHVRLPGADGIFALPAIVRWVKADGMGVQFGSLGAKETYLITEIGRTAE